MSNRRKNAQNCCVFRRASSSFLSINAREWFHQSGFHFLGAHELFLLGRHELIPGTRIEHELNTNCSRNVQKLMRHLMRQLMGINGETVLARSAPKKNWERT